MIPAIRLVWVSSKRVESVISRHYICRKLILARSRSGPKLELPSNSCFLPQRDRDTRRPLSSRGFQRDSALNPVVRFLT